MTLAQDALARSKNSTNVRTVPWEVLGLRAGFRLLSPTAPTVAARLAEQLFFKARRHPRPAWEHEILERGTPFRVRFRDAPLHAWSWGSGREAVLLVHGWEGRGAQLGAFVAPLLDAGLRVVTFDGPAHGDSPGERASMVDHAEAVARVAETVGPLRGVIAHSIGSLSTLLAMSWHPTASRFVLVSPPAGPTRYTETFARTFALGDHVGDLMRARIEARYVTPLRELHGPALAARVRGELLLVHDRDDRETPVADGEALADAWPGAQRLFTRGLGHRRILRDPAVLQAAVSFLRRGAEG